MKKSITIFTILLMLLTLSVMFTACGNKCEHTYDNACDATCNECGEERTITHTPSADDGDCTTPITCSVCKATTTPARDSHMGGTATCTEKASCTVCGTAYGTIDANNHIDGNADHICDRNCGKTDIGRHADSAEDNDHVCDYGCGATLEEHKGGTATCVSGNLCEICGVEYDTTKNPNNHTSTEFTYTENNDGTHNKLYACCEAVHTANEACSGGTATCVSGKICDFCEITYGDVDSANHASENYTYTDNGDGTHTKTHECGVVVGEPENHTLTYTANINIITETCSVGCGYSETATIIARDAIYDGLVHNTAIVDYSEGWKGGELTISYANNVNAGAATASITVGEATATVDFTIAKAPLTVTADAKIKSYGDENPTLTYTAEGLLGGDTLTSALTGALSREEGENVGLYAITLGTLSADNYTISFEGADFTIQVKEVTNPTVNLDQTSYQYDGTPKTPKVMSIVVDGRTLTESTDYNISYADNVYVGERAAVVINFMGNYDGEFHRWFAITQDPKTTEFDGECIGNGELPDSHVSQIANGSTGCDLSLPMHVYQSVPETETPAVEFVGQQLNIGGGISLKFYVRNNEDRPIESICVEVEFLGKLTYLTECEKHPTEDKVYIYTFEDINPQCLGDLMNVTILVGGIPLWHENTVLMDYSVEKNLLEIRKTADDLTVQLIDDLLAYGEAASAYKNHQTMSGTSYAENGSNREIPVSEAERFEIGPNLPLVEQYTVRFGTTLSIKIKVSYLPKVKVYVNGNEYVTTEEDVKREYIIFESEPISTTDFDKDFSVIIQNGEGETYSYIHVSVNDYLYAISQSETASAEMKALAKALYNYGYSTKVYPHLSQKDDNHLFVYTVNEDGTHTRICVCGEEVSEEHNVSSVTGACLECEAFVAAASIAVDGVKTYYATFEEAIAYANGQDSTVIVIENECTVNGKVDFESGSVMIDLNGKEIDSTSNYIFYYAGGSITIRDSAGGGRTVQSVDGSTVIIEGGTHAKNVGGNNLIVTGGNFAYVAVTTGETATISGGSFEEIRIHSSVGSLDDMLADGYCFYDKNGNVVDTSTIQTDSRNWYNLYNVTVGVIKEN